MSKPLNWKAISQSLGYISLRKAYERDVQAANRTRQRGHRPMRGKKEFQKQFQMIISRAVQRHTVTGEPVEDILLRWETKRGNVWWMNYTHNMECPVYKRTNERIGKRGIRRWYAKQRWEKSTITLKLQNHAICDRERKGKKKRWTKDQKIQAAWLRKYKAEQRSL